MRNRLYFPYFTILCLLHPAHRARRNTFFSDRQQSSDGHASRTPPGRRSGPLSRPGGGAPLQSLPWPRAPYKRISNSYFEIPSIVLVFTPSVSGTKSGAAAPPFLVFTPSVSGTKSGAAARVGGPTRAGNRASAGAGASACARRTSSPPPSQRTFKSVPPFPWDPAPGGVRPLAGRLRRLYAASWSSRVTESAPATAQAATAELDRAFAVTGRPARPSPHPFQGPPHTRSTRRLSGRQGAA